MIKALRKNGTTICETAVLFVFIVMAIFTNKNAVFNVGNVVNSTIGLQLLDDFSSINRETITWLYDIGKSDIWVNHEILACILMGLCSKVSECFFGYLFSIIYSVVLVVEFNRNKKHSVGGNFIFCIFNAFMFCKLATLTGFGRPVAIGIILCMLFLIVNCNIEEYRDNKRLENINAVAFAVILLLWSVSHGGSYPITLVIFGCFGLSEVAKSKSLKSVGLFWKYIIAYVVTTLIILIIPVTRKSIMYNFIQHSNKKYIGEWQSMASYLKATPIGESEALLAFILISIAAVILSLRLYKKEEAKKFLKNNFGLVVLIAGTFIMSLTCMRYIQYFGCICSIVVPRKSKGYEQLEKKYYYLVVGMTAICCVACKFINGNDVIDMLYKSQVKNSREFIARQSEGEDTGLYISDEFLDKLVEDTSLKLFETDLHDVSMEDYLVEHGMRVFVDGRSDNVHEDVYETVFTIVNSGRYSKEEVVEAYSKIREWGSDLFIFELSGENDTERNIDIIKELVGGDNEIIAESKGEKGTYYLLRIYY